VELQAYTKAVAAVLNAYRLRARAAGRVSDVLFKTVDRGVLSFEQLASEIGAVLPQAAGLGVGLDQVGASIATMTAQGFSAGDAANRLQNPVHCPDEGPRQARRGDRRSGLRLRRADDPAPRAGRKNMSPANIEAELKSAGRLIGQAAVIGDGRPYNTALLVFDADGAAAWAERDGIAGRSLEALAADERDLAAVRAEGDVAIARLSRVEQIKRFHVVAGDWVPGGVELTPTMKLRRRPIAEKYAEAIEGLYRG
jgi:hypothetical protein